MASMVDNAAEKVAERFREALAKAYDDARQSDEFADIPDMNAFIGFIVWDWLMSHGYLQHDESTEIELPT